MLNKLVLVLDLYSMQLFVVCKNEEPLETLRFVDRLKHPQLHDSKSIL